MNEVWDKPVKYYKKDIKHLRKKYKPGRVLEITRLRTDGEEMTRIQKERVTVVKTFPNIVSCVDANGFRRTFKYFDLEENAKIIR